MKKYYISLLIICLFTSNSVFAFWGEYFWDVDKQNKTALFEDTVAGLLTKEELQKWWKSNEKFSCDNEIWSTSSDCDAHICMLPVQQTKYNWKEKISFNYKNLELANNKHIPKDIRSIYNQIEKEEKHEIEGVKNNIEMISNEGTKQYLIYENIYPGNEEKFNSNENHMFSKLKKTLPQDEITRIELINNRLFIISVFKNGSLMSEEEKKQCLLRFENLEIQKSLTLIYPPEEPKQKKSRSFAKNQQQKSRRR